MSDTDGLSIPDSVLEKLNKRGIKSSDIRLKTTADLDFYGNPSVIWVFATETKILVIPETGLQEELEFELSRIKRFRIRASVGSAYLQARVDDFFIELVRFTNALRYRFSRLIVQLDLLRQGKPVSDEYINEPHPMTCP
ncbi:MAG TPA: hypothetical protein PKK91_08255, partial [bacterium]|nr:hypothetical protein [bacterium]